MQKIIRASAICIIAIAVLLPLLLQVVWSFALQWFFPSLMPTQWSTDAWQYVFSPSSRVVESLLNSLGIATGACTLSILIGLPAARALAFHEFKGKEIVEWVLLIPIIVPSIVSILGIHQIFIRMHLTHTFLGVSLAHLIPCLPYMILVMTSVFANYGTELEDTARTLGADRLRVFWHVTLPGILPGLTVATMFTFLISWGQYITTVLIGGGTIVTLPMVLFPFISSGNYANASAISLIFVAPALLILLLTTKRLETNPSVMGGFGRL